jgi:AraC-like DNA-binding protein
MVSGKANAATGAYEVGYGSASHFNGDYVRAFGASPARDVARLRAAVVGSHSADYASSSQRASSAFAADALGPRCCSGNEHQRP